jgi:hypothetical protein
MKMRISSPWTKILLLLIASRSQSDVVLAQNISGESPCQMQILVYDEFSLCIDPQGLTLAKATAFLVADGQCRTANTTTLPSDPVYTLLPGNYRAECVNSTAVRFLESGCISNQCNTTSLVQGATCDRNNSIASSLYSRVPVPEFLTFSDPNSSYQCVSTEGSNVTVSFVIFGSCSAPGCSVITTPAPITGSVPTATPMTAAPLPTTFQPVVGVVPTLSPLMPSPIEITPPAFITTDSPTRTPNDNPTLSPVNVDAPVLSPAANTISPQLQKPLPPPPTDATSPSIDSGIPTTSIEKSSSSVVSSGLIAGVAVGVAFLAVILALFLLRRRKQPDGTRPSGNSTKIVDDVSDNHVSNPVIGASGRKNCDLHRVDEFNQPSRNTTNEIWIDPNVDDVSTLGGGTLPPGFGGGQDEPTASVNLDFDFNRNQYRTDAEDRTQSQQTSSSNPTTFTSLSKLGLHPETDFADDLSFEEQFAEIDDDELRSHTFDDSNNVSNRVKPFEVRAPPGKLGMVVDTPNGGVPVVRAIKPDSALSGSVQVGDRLISVDHINVTSMSALEVSNLISLKQNQQRLLIFCRLAPPTAS